MNALQKKDEECRQLAGLVSDSERRLKKVQATSKNNLKYKHAAKDKDRALVSIRTELGVQKAQSTKLADQVKTMQAEKNLNPYK